MTQRLRVRPVSLQHFRCASLALVLAATTGAAVAQAAPAIGSRGAVQTGQAPGLPAGTGLPSVQPGVQPASPGPNVPPGAVAAPTSPGFSLPNAGGLPSPLPPQLAAPAPALPAGIPAPAGTQPQPVTPQVLQPVPQGGTRVVIPPTAGSPLPSPGPGPYTAVQVLQAFQAADTDGDGELTRAEATHLRIKPMSFEEMDRNKDGILTRGEYENAFR